MSKLIIICVVIVSFYLLEQCKIFFAIANSYLHELLDLCCTSEFYLHELIEICVIIASFTFRSWLRYVLLYRVYLHELCEIRFVIARLVSISCSNVKKVFIAGCDRFNIVNISSWCKLKNIKKWITKWLSQPFTFYYQCYKFKIEIYSVNKNTPWHIVSVDWTWTEISLLTSYSF